MRTGKLKIDAKKELKQNPRPKIRAYLNNRSAIADGKSYMGV